MRLGVVALTLLFAACSAPPTSTRCGGTACSAGQQCCTACGGRQYCAASCPDIGSCRDAALVEPDAGVARDGGTDAGALDAGEPDAGELDAGEPDAGELDAGVDAGELDAGELDAGELDAGVDAGELDAGVDAGELDAGVDAGALDAGVDASSGVDLDAGPPPCPAGECRVASEACELPTGPTGNGCCACAGSVCSVPCRCLAADTAIATPSGDVPVSELSVGDLVFSEHDGGVVAVPIVEVRRVPVLDHVMVRVRLASGATLRASPIHPTADGRRFADLARGDALDGVAILEATLEPYEGVFTYDLLPASDSATYYVGGVRVGSTLGAPPR